MLGESVDCYSIGDMFLRGLHFVSPIILAVNSDYICIVCAVALSYSLQILDEGIIPITPNDMFVDALVSPSGVIPISPFGREYCCL